MPKSQANRPNRKEDRNLALIEDYNSKKYSIVDLVSKYRITSQRIYEILEENHE